MEKRLADRQVDRKGQGRTGRSDDE